MSYSEALKAFAASHKYEDVMVDGAKFHYVLNGRKDSQTLVMLNGGMNTLEMWMNYVDAFSEDYQPGTGNGHACFFQENWRKKTNLCRSQ